MSVGLEGLLAVELLAVRLLTVRLLAIRLLAVELLTVRLLAVRLLAVGLLAVGLLAVRLLAVGLLAVGLLTIRWLLVRLWSLLAVGAGSTLLRLEVRLLGRILIAHVRRPFSRTPCATLAVWSFAAAGWAAAMPWGIEGRTGLGGYPAGRNYFMCSQKLCG